jgi:hypothetical protein
VVAGAVVLLASVVPQEKRWDLLNPASMKQALVEGAKKIPGPGLYEQGAGRLDLQASHEILKHYTPRASLVGRYTSFPHSVPVHTCLLLFLLLLLPLMVYRTHSPREQVARPGNRTRRVCTGSPSIL